eukprot:m.150835 g.150835  ORF g.150835 m.150835 type:complete len:110 (-) comp14276_c0_seq2:1128-1457(-)
MKNWFNILGIRRTVNCGGLETSSSTVSPVGDSVAEHPRQIEVAPEHDGDDCSTSALSVSEDSCSTEQITETIRTQHRNPALLTESTAFPADRRTCRRSLTFSMEIMARV